MRRTPFFLALLATSGVASAADKPLYAPAPAWVKPAPAIDTTKLTDASPVALRLDTQQRLEGGRVWSYVDVATRAATAQQLSEIGDVKLQWQPSRGDLIIHTAEILRDGRRIDLVKGGQPFTILRRETELDQRMLDGNLTATMAAEGLATGDVLHLVFSITAQDPTLGGKLQTYAPLPADPVQIGFGRVRLSWPDKSDVRWKSYAEGVAPTAVLADGYRELEVALPLAKQPEIPGDAPARFQRLPILEATTFPDWAAVSKTMAPLYATDGLIAAGSPLAAEVARITAAEADPLHRAALALRLVQDKIRYLMLGMDTGNYVPQTPTQTWERRYGDCKAKTLLLLALLHAMKIAAEPVLAHTALGDMVPQRLPGAGAFNHVLVRARIGAGDYWLDGTGAGTRLADLADTPRLGTVLPVRAAGAALLPVVLRPDARAAVTVDVDLDDRAGVDVPTLTKASLTLRGAAAERMQAIASQANAEQRRQLAQQLMSSQVGSGDFVDPQLSYDDATATMTIGAVGISGTRWGRSERRYRLALDGVLGKIDFSPDRARTAWQAIPVVLPGPGSIVYRTTLHLPDGGKDYVIEGDRVLPPTLGGAALKRTVTSTPDTIVVEDRLDQIGGEMPAAALPAARAALSQARARQLTVVAPATLLGTTAYWTAKRQQGLARPVEAMFARIMAADPKNVNPHEWRARYRLGGADRTGAVADYTGAIAIEPSVTLYLARAGVYARLGEDARQLADIEAALTLDPDSETAIGALAGYRARHDAVAEAVALLDRRIENAGSKDRARWLAAKADAQAGGGQYEAAIATIDTGLAERANQPELLNQRCWMRGLGNLMLDKGLKDCTRAIELGDDATAALDSRAMIYFRMGRFDDALADLTAALDAAPDLAPSLFMRGVVLNRLGHRAEGAAAIAQAQLIDPQVTKTYARYGIAP